MTETLDFYTFLTLLVWFVVWIAIVAVLRATQSEKEKQDETYCAINNIPHMSNTEFWTGLSIFWPVLLLLIPFFLLYKAIYNLTKKLTAHEKDNV